MSARRSIAALVLPAAVAAPAIAGEPQLGRIDFPNSGAAAAQEAFVRGVLLLHSFEYEDAAEAFREAQRVDPAFALAYWGEAMTHNHPLWKEQDRDAAREALARFAPTPEERRARTPTERERDWLDAVEALYGDGDKIARDLAYCAAMERLAERYPSDLEARAFHALSILGTVQGVRDFRVYMRAGAVAEEVFAANELHPGAVHYMIHAYDDPVHAPLGLRAARVYARIAPAASHAQHMISHIYVALGRWAESVDANVKSFDMSVERRAAKGLDADALNYHSLHWLEYSYLQLGRFDDAREALARMTAYAEESGSPRALWHHAAMRAAWIVESGGREAPPELRAEETQVTGAAADLFATGYAALLAGDPEAALLAAGRIAGRQDAAASGHLCGQTGGVRETSKQDLAVAGILRKTLLALIEMDRGRTAAAIALFEEATAAEEGLPPDFGPPIVVKPSHEAYGEALLALGRHAEARAQFAKALGRAPRRSLALAGLARAAQAAGDAEAVARTCAEIADIYAAADDSAVRPAACGTGAPVEQAAARR
jgi:tetratricopeptide (TPR) repeat protein